MANEAELRDYLKKAVQTLQRTRRRLREVETRTTEPIAIIGMACRFPGGIGTPDQLWQRVIDGRDLITPFPTNRGWHSEGMFDADPDKFAKSYVCEGAFLESPGEFDAGFFGISPQEALAMDPQQRLVLEVAWEAIEQARIDPHSLRGSRTGVFLGSADQGYALGSAALWDGQISETYFLTGNNCAMASGRICYLLGLEGPAVTLDTACSSSLVAVHQAASALRTGECEFALSGGVSIMATPAGFSMFARQRALAADGRCKSFAAAADGTAFGEGVGLVLLERLSDARRSGHPVLAVLRGSAVNQDGASNGLTAPNGLAQQRVINQALAAAGLSAAEVDVVEGHGTGTVLGDPIEAQALLATYGKHRPPGQPLLLGSIKSNMGHTQLAAGVSGLIKLVEAMRHGMVPPTLHVDEPSPHVDWSTGEVRLVTEAQPWPGTNTTRRAAISSFGISGTNVHVVLERAAEPAVPAVSDRPVDPELPVPWVISAKNAKALCAQAVRLREWLGPNDPLRPVDVGHSLATTRSRFEHRAILVARTTGEFRDGLAALADQALSPFVVQAPRGPRGKLAMVLPGQGSQHVAMGRDLYHTYPRFARALDEVCAAFDAHLSYPLRDVIFGENDCAGTDLLDRTEYTQPALFAVEVALLRLLQSWGVAPDFLLGHSLGELAAAHIGGVFTLADAATVVTARGKLMQRLPAGAMLSIRAGLAEVLESLTGAEGEVAVAASNGPNATVISGDEVAVTRLGRRWRQRGRRIKRLRTDRAFHSPHLDAVLDEFRDVFAGIQLSDSAIPLLSNVTGRPAEPGELSTADYWLRQMRAPVRFHDSVRELLDAGVTTFLEVGPGDVLSGISYESFTNPACAAIPALGPAPDEATGLLRALGSVWTRGIEVDWGATFADRQAETIDLPTYAFQRRTYWLGADNNSTIADSDDIAGPAEADTVFVQQLALLPEAERADAALQFVRSQIRRILLDHTDADIDVDATVLEVGLTSLSALELRSRINAAAGIEISMEDLFSNPTPRGLANLLVGLADPERDSITAPVSVGESA